MRSEIAQDAIKKQRILINQKSRQQFIEALSKAKENAPDINIELSQLSGLKEFRLNPNYTTWFKQRSTEHLQLACEYTVFLSNIDNVINNQYKIDFYRNFWYPSKLEK